MSIFLITPFAGQEALSAEINSAVAEHDRYQINNGGWLIKFDGTSRELSDKLKISTDPSISSALVVSISGYYGRGSTDMWEWIKSRLE